MTSEPLFNPHDDFLDALAAYFVNEADQEDVEPFARRWIERDKDPQR